MRWAWESCVSFESLGVVMHVCPKCLECTSNWGHSSYLSPVKTGAKHKMSLSFYTELCNIVFIPRRCDLLLYHYHSTAGTCGCGTVGGSTGASCGEFFLVSQLAWYITSSISLTLNHGHPSTQFCCSKNNKNTSSRFQSNPGVKMIDWIKEWRS